MKLKHNSPCPFNKSLPHLIADIKLKNLIEVQMNTEEFNKARSEITDDDLIEKARTILSELCETGAKTFRMTIPPQLDDTDMIFGELINRYRKAIQVQAKVKTEQQGLSAGNAGYNFLPGLMGKYKYVLERLEPYPFKIRNELRKNMTNLPLRWKAVAFSNDFETLEKMVDETHRVSNWLTLEVLAKKL